MKTRTTLWLIASVLTLTAGYASAQNSPPKEEHAKPGLHAMRDKDGKHRGMRMKHHMQKLKADLKLSPDQEPAWTAMASVMKPPARPPRPDRAEIEKLSMPERLDKLKQVMAQRHEARMSELDKRATAVKNLYAVLTPEQKKTFDAKAAPHWVRDSRHN